MPIIDSRSDVSKFDALIRTNKDDSLMAFIKASYNVKQEDNRKAIIAKKLKMFYELYKESGARSYGNSDRDLLDQFESHYTMGYEMGIWIDSDLNLSDLAIKVAEYSITVKEYIGIVFRNLFTYYEVDGKSKYHHFLYEILKKIKENNLMKGEISKDVIKNTLPISDKQAEQGNLIFNYLISSDFFEKVSKDTFKISEKWIQKFDDLFSLCNLEYQNLDKSQAFEMAKDKKKYSDYISKTSINTSDSPFIDESKRLSIGENILLYGVPGSGKSWTIEHEYCKKDSEVERLVFHPDYTYSDFIGQILPNVADDGQVSYKFTPGPFTTILRGAYHNPDKEYILIIEEINRGNAPAIFGEVFQLLDRKTEIRSVNDDGYPIGTSEYGITNMNIAEEMYGKERKTDKVRIPSNLSIIGTMNTSDQNVFTLDTAFQRRWEMRLIENDCKYGDQELLNKEILDTKVKWKTFCAEINKIIVENNVRMTSSEDKRLGVHFVHLSDLVFDKKMDNLSHEYDKLRQLEQGKAIDAKGKERLKEIRDAMKQNRKFPEKVIKYLWDDAFKFNREIIFETETHQSLEQIIHTFIYEKGEGRFAVFKDNVRSAFTNSED